jgi:hypothetical protein
VVERVVVGDGPLKAALEVLQVRRSTREVFEDTPAAPPRPGSCSDRRIKASAGSLGSNLRLSRVPAAEALRGPGGVSRYRVVAFARRNCSINGSSRAVTLARQ